MKHNTFVQAIATLVAIVMLTSCSQPRQEATTAIADMEGTVAARVQATVSALPPSTAAATAAYQSPSDSGASSGTVPSAEGGLGSGDSTPPPSAAPAMSYQKGSWAESVITTTVGAKDTARPGYRLASVRTYIRNVGGQVTVITRPFIIIPTLVDRGVKSYCRPSFSPRANSMKLPLIPPGYGYTVFYMCELANTATDATVQFNYTLGEIGTQQELGIEVPLTPGENGVDSTATGQAYQKEYNPPPSLADFAKDLPVIGSTATLTDVAEITLASASFDPKGFWVIDARLQNTGATSLATEKLSRSGEKTRYVLFEVFNEWEVHGYRGLEAVVDPGTAKVVPPGSETTWPLAIQSTPSPAVLFVVVLADEYWYREGAIGGADMSDLHLPYALFRLS